MAPLVGGIVWVLLFMVYVGLVWANPRRRQAADPQRVPEPVVVGVGVAALVAGGASLFLLLRELVPG